MQSSRYAFVSLPPEVCHLYMQVVLGGTREEAIFGGELRYTRQVIVASLSSCFFVVGKIWNIICLLAYVYHDFGISPKSIFPPDLSAPWLWNFSILSWPLGHDVHESCYELWVKKAKQVKCSAHGEPRVDRAYAMSPKTTAASTCKHTAAKSS